MTSPQILAGVRPPVRSIESVLTNRWARWLIPSLSDLFFLAILIWLFMSSGSAGWQGLLVDGDVGWHIRTGQYILDHHAVPRHDLYSFSKPDAPWYAWEWLTDVIDGSLHRLAGVKGDRSDGGRSDCHVRDHADPENGLAWGAPVRRDGGGAGGRGLGFHPFSGAAAHFYVAAAFDLRMDDRGRSQSSQPQDLVAGPHDRGLDQSARGIPGADRDVGAGCGWY